MSHIFSSRTHTNTTFFKFFAASNKQYKICSVLFVLGAVFSLFGACLLVQQRMRKAVQMGCNATTSYATQHQRDWMMGNYNTNRNNNAHNNSNNRNNNNHGLTSMLKLSDVSVASMANVIADQSYPCISSHEGVDSDYSMPAISMFAPKNNHIMTGLSLVLFICAGLTSTFLPDSINGWLHGPQQISKKGSFSLLSGVCVVCD